MSLDCLKKAGVCVYVFIMKERGAFRHRLLLCSRAWTVSGAMEPFVTPLETQYLKVKKNKMINNIVQLDNIDNSNWHL